MTETVKRNPFRSLGILFSLAAAIGLGVVFYFSYNYLVSRNEHLSNQVSALKANLEQQYQQTAEEINQQSKTLSSVQQMQTESKNIWAMQEVNYLIQLASDNLQFEKNIPLAIQILKTADQKVQTITDTKAQSLRDALTADINALQSLPAVDIAKVYSQLTVLNELVDKLSLPTQIAPKASLITTDENLPWWKQGLQQTWQALSKIVIVRYHDGTVPLATPEENVFLHQNLHSMFERAMWGLMHHESEIYQTSLQQAAEWIKKYFVQDEQAQAILSQISELQQVDVMPKIPELTSLKIF